MKPFNLEEALKGAPVKLRGGNKAYVVANIKELLPSPQTSRVLLGVYSHISDSNRFGGLVRWEVSGVVCMGARLNEEPYDIVEMWEEPKLTQEQILEKAYNENLKVIYDKALLTDGYEVIAKTKDGEYILRNCDYIEQTSEDMTNFRIYEEKPITPTITVTLPKRYIPNVGDAYYRIGTNALGNLCVKEATKCHNDEDVTGKRFCFRAREDAQAWLDAMKGALDE